MYSPEKDEVCQTDLKMHSGDANPILKTVQDPYSRRYGWTACPAGPQPRLLAAWKQDATSAKASSLQAGPIMVTPKGSTGVAFPVAARCCARSASSPAQHLQGDSGVQTVQAMLAGCLLQKLCDSLRCLPTERGVACHLLHCWG